MSRILLILPPASFSDPFHLGLGSIAAFLQQHGIKCSVWHPHDYAEVKARVHEFHPWLIGISSTDITYPVAQKTAECLRTVLSEDIPITLGGRYVSTLDTKVAHHTLNSGYFDYVIRGEGEETLLELIFSLQMNGNISRIRGLSWRSECGQIFHNPPRPLKSNLDDWPSPLRQMDFRPMNLDKAGPVLSVRDCIHGCQPCTHCNFESERLRSIPNVLGELHSIQAAGYRSFHFADRDFFSREKRLLELAQAMQSSGLHLNWGCIASPRCLSMNTLEQLAEASCRLVLFFTNPSNAGDKTTLNAVKRTRDAGIGVTLGLFELRDLSKDLPPASELRGLKLNGLVLGFHPAYTPFTTALTLLRQYKAELPGVNIQLQDGYPLKSAHGDALKITSNLPLVSCPYQTIADQERTDL